MKYEAFVFDLDGTLVDSAADLGSSVNRVLEANGFPVHEICKYNNYIGDGAEMMVRRALPNENRDESTVKQCLEQFLEDYSENYSVLTKPYEGIPELLDTLTSKNLKLAVLTNKPCEISRKLVSEVLPAWYFEEVIGHKEGIPKKPDPGGALLIAKRLGIKTDKIVYLGDSGVDMKAANSAGMLPVGVLWGFRGKEELVREGALHLISTPMEICEIIDL